MKLNILTLKVFNARLNCCPKENKPRNSNFFPAKYSSFPVLSQDIFEKTKNIFFSGNEYKSDFMLNAYEEFCLQFSNEYKDASLVDIVREIFKTSQPIGQGTQKRVYDFPRLENYVVAYLYHKKMNPQIYQTYQIF